MKDHKHKHLIPLSILLGISIISLSMSWSYADDPFIPEAEDISGIFGNPYVKGQFSEDGNAGNIIASGMTLDTTDPINPTINGEWIFIETVGWAKLTNNSTVLPSGDAKLNIKIGSDTGPWPLEMAYAWSDNAGWLTLHSLDENSYSGVGFVPGSRSFSGFAWSDTLGYVDFGTANTEFKNKVKILGNLGGNKSFDTEYALGAKFNSVSTNSFFNKLHKDIALLIRGLATSDSRINKEPSNIEVLNNDTLYYKVPATSLPYKVNADLLNETHTRSLIIEGGDISITGDITNDPSVKKSRTLIAIKDTNGKGGNIYIGKNVKNIYTSIIAEGNIYSGEDSTLIYNNEARKILVLPKNQLYIYGSTISHNTIGGATIKPRPVCPYIEGICTFDLSIRYDWNYFRTYDNRKAIYESDKKGFDEYSVIIEYDPRIMLDPPPGIAIASI